MARCNSVRASVVAVAVLLGFSHACLGVGDDDPTLEPPSDLAAELNPHANWGLSVLLEVENASIPLRLQTLGFLPRFCFQNYCTGDILPSQVRAVLQMPGVRTVRFLGISHSAAHQNAQHPVLVAIVDEGIYWRDPSFWQPANRIQWFWDQKKSVRKGRVPYGEEYSGAELKNVRGLREKLPSEFGHGFPTSVVAAGYLPTHHVIEQPGFPDIPSTTSVILVNTTGRADDVLDAVAYVIHRAHEANAHTVINVSFGGHFGPHDGSDTFTQALDSLVGDEAILVVAAGDDGRRSAYTKSIGNPASVNFTVDNCVGEEATLMVEGWYDAALGAGVVVADPTDLHSDIVMAGDVSGWRGAQYGGVLDHRLSSRNGKLNGFGVFVQGKCDHLIGKWQLQLQNAASGNSLEMWVTTAEGVRVRLEHVADTPPGYSAMAGSAHVISVGAYAVNPSDLNLSVDPDTSWGITRAGDRKPDVLAPGKVRFFSAGIKDHPTSSGTSIAAAVVTRCIVHLWSSNPTIPPQDIRNRLRSVALVPAGKADWKNNTPFKSTTCGP